MFDEEGATIATTSILPAHKFQYKASSSKSTLDFGSSSSTPDTESSLKLHDDAATKPDPSVQPDNPDHNDSSDSTRSLAGKHIDPLALLEIQENVFRTMKKVETIEASVSRVNSNIEEKVSKLDSKLDTIIQSLSNQSQPSIAKREAQLDKIISLWLKHSIKEIKATYDASVEHYLDTITMMLKVHEVLVIATNDLIKQTHIRHGKQIQRLEKEIKKKDEMNLIIQQVLIKLL